jgi:MoxR-like ATPase
VHSWPGDDVAAVEACDRAYNQIRDELSKVVVGQHAVIEQLLIVLFARGHALVEGVPGLAKTLLVRSVAESLGLSFKRIQFTPDLMPSDITGTDVLQEDPETRERCYRFLPGPVFANMILADEVNRTPPKTQAAMLEAMQERQVTAGGNLHPLPDPFLVLATQNPIEHEGTYPLPEAQLDRFLLQISMDYPTGAEEWEIARRVTSQQLVPIRCCLTAQQIQEVQRLITRVPVSDQVLGYAWTIVRATRPRTVDALEPADEWLTWGAGPRGLLALVTGAKARAVLYGRFHATTDDVQALVKPALRHRLVLNYSAQASGMTPDRLIEQIIDRIPPDDPYERPV